MNAQTYNWYRTPVGFVTIAASAAGVCGLAFGCVEVPGARHVASATTTAAANQVLEYFAGKRRTFDFPIDMQGGEFKERVWRALQDVPYGMSLTASELAERLGSPGAQRSVGAAIKANPLALVVPAHRVVTATGHATGTAKAASQHAALLAFEQAQLAKEQGTTI